MSAHQRRKGRAGELEVQKRLNEHGFDAELLYGQAELGGQDGDVDSLVGRFEVKRRAAFPAWLNLADNVRGVYCRRDRGPWYVVMRASDVEKLLMMERAYKVGAPGLALDIVTSVHDITRAGLCVEAGEKQ